MNNEKSTAVHTVDNVHELSVDECILEELETENWLLAEDAKWLKWKLTDVKESEERTRFWLSHVKTSYIASITGSWVILILNLVFCK